MEKKAYVEISLSIGAEYFDVAIALLSQIGYEAFWEDGDTLRAICQQPCGTLRENVPRRRL